MKKQNFFPKKADIGPHNTIVVRTLGLDQPDGIFFRQGRDWRKHQVLRHDKVLLSVLEGYQAAQSIAYTRQEDYLKVNFWLGGKHTTVLDGFGQFEHDRPEVFITAGPLDMLKVDMCGGNAQIASVAVCLQRDFFPSCMGIDLDNLPQPLRGLLTSHGSSYAFHRYPLSLDIIAATRSILAAPFALRREPLYIQAKAIELMCLLINCVESHARRSGTGNKPSARQEARLYEARDLLTHHYAEPITLERVSRDVGLNKMALTRGFRQLFGMTVHDCLLKLRMERAYELLQDDNNTIGRIAEAVGYSHPCNFSTAFHAYFGCTPQNARARGN